MSNNPTPISPKAHTSWRSSPTGVASEQERESKKAASVAAESELIASKAQVALDEADVSRLTSLTEFKQVKAPFEGTIVERDIDIGDIVTAGSGSGMSALYRVARNKPMRVFVNVPQSAADDLLMGNAQARNAIGGNPDQHYDGKVSRTSRAINPQSRTLRVEVDIPNADAHPVPAALLFRPKPQVAIVDKNVVEFRDVKIGVDQGNVVQVESGLKEGDKVVLNLSGQIAAGMKVDAHELSHPPSAKP
jgi:multidrug efflux pump subunit AcrA (membrane-fusion protein)